MRRFFCDKKTLIVQFFYVRLLALHYNYLYYLTKTYTTMKENFIGRIQSLIGESNLQFKRWDTLINLYVLPKIAGKDTRECISDEFLNLVADYGSEICAKDSYIAGAILEICLQRLANGAVTSPKNGICFSGSLPEEYAEYSSYNDEPSPMTAGCYNFLINGIELAFFNPSTKNHASAILFELMDKTSPFGDVENKAELGQYAGCATFMFGHAKQIVERHLSFEELYVHYAQPNQWEKHIEWFKNNQHLINWEKFFKDVNVAQQGNRFFCWQAKRRIKKFILR